MVQVCISRVAALAFAAAMLAACSSGSGTTNPGPPMQNHSGLSAAVTPPPVLSTLTLEQTIGSTSPDTPHDVNPYGLDVAKVTSGEIDAGDLVVCDFNNPGNVQGTGTEIVALHPVVGSTPRLIVKDHTLMGCNAVATAPTGSVWAAAFKANDNPIFTSSGTLVTTLSDGPWNHPFGEAYAGLVMAGNNPTFYVSNAGDGSLVRVTVHPSSTELVPCTPTTCTFTFTVIATGFPVNHGKPGSILGPSGLNYLAAGDRLYVVDGTNNALYAIDNVSSVGANGINVDASGQHFTGASAASAHVIFSGPPLNGPISSAILPGGNIAVGNTLDPDGQNLIVEISPSGEELFVKNVDTGPAGAIFGMVATGTSTADAKLYFNDDNDNTVKVLSH